MPWCHVGRVLCLAQCLPGVGWKPLLPAILSLEALNLPLASRCRLLTSCLGSLAWKPGRAFLHSWEPDQSIRVFIHPFMYLLDHWKTQATSPSHSTGPNRHPHLPTTKVSPAPQSLGDLSLSSRRCGEDSLERTVASVVRGDGRRGKTARALRGSLTELVLRIRLLGPSAAGAPCLGSKEIDPEGVRAQAVVNGQRMEKRKVPWPISFSSETLQGVSC